MEFKSFIKLKESVDRTLDEDHMLSAINIANKAKLKGDYSIGSVVVFSDMQLSEHDTTLSDGNPLSSAGLKVIRKAVETVPNKVKNSILYSTLEPDVMTVLAAIKSGINEVVFGCYDYKNGFVSSIRKLNLEHYDITFKGGVLSEYCLDILPDEMKEYCGLSDKPE